MRGFLTALFSSAILPFTGKISIEYNLFHKAKLLPHLRTLTTMTSPANTTVPDDLDIKLDAGARVCTLLGVETGGNSQSALRSLGDLKMPGLGSVDAALLYLSIGAMIGTRANTHNALLWKQVLDTEIGVNTSGKAPLSQAVVCSRKQSSHYPDALRHMIREGGLDPNQRNSSGRTLLMNAAIGNWPEHAQVLLQEGADPTLRAQDFSDPATALMLAVRLKNEAVALVIGAFIAKQKMDSILRAAKVAQP